MNGKVISAVFKRDFVSYFSNPTGYVFICVFVMLSSLAAFWPPEFFSNNLANLDQLSRWMPFILVVFVPAITMSIWAEERRQGTDELLLTLPASDFDVVLGKFLAAVSIFAVSLLFSAFSIFLVFSWGLGNPDPGLFFCTYLGYLLVGVAMLSIGMVASFLTSNLTVGFILGMLFNAPLALFGVAEWVVKDPQWAQAIRNWSAVEQFSDFARGVVSLSGVAYFLSIAAVMLYVSMVLIGRRHWTGGEGGMYRGVNYAARAVALLIAAGAVNVILSHHDPVRADVTSESLNSLAPKTKELVRGLSDDEEVDPIKVDVYVSPTVPAEYAAQKRELLNTLRELSSLSGGKVQANIHEIEVFSEQATLAERTYGIEPRSVATNVRGARSLQEIFLGAAFTSGLEKVVIPFFDRGIPVEYELVRSIATVAQQERKRVGVLKTDAPLMGGFSMQGPTEEARIITELKKQYDIVEVDPATPITEQFDVLLAVQPSSLGPEAMTNFVDAVRSGQPTAIFEDPLPGLIRGVPGTAEPKRPGGMMGMMGGGRPEPKGDINQLWDLLGVRMPGDQLVWQAYNPYPAAGADVTYQWVFIDEGSGAVQPFNPNDPISAGLNQLLFFYAGSVSDEQREDVEFVNLAVTGTRTGTISASQLRRQGDMPGGSPMHRPTGASYILAAHVRGEAVDDTQLQLDRSVTDEDLEAAEEQLDEMSATQDDEADAEQAQDEQEGAARFNVVLVADIDCLSDVFFGLREMGQDDMMIDWRFQNVTFVLNTLDSLAGDDRFLDLRKRVRDFRTLTKIEDATAEFRAAAQEQQQDYQERAEEQKRAAEEEFSQKLAEIQNRTDISDAEKEMLMQQAQIRASLARDVKIQRLEDERDRKVRQSERELNARIRGVQDRYKFFAVALPPILPILLAFLVFFHRRKQEQEGVSKDRLRYGGPKEKRSNKGEAA